MGKSLDGKEFLFMYEMAQQGIKHRK